MKYFTITELCRSTRASQLNVPNIPDATQVSNLIRLTDNVLDPLREWYGKPINVSSGFRSKELNDVTPGSSNTSQHSLGEAADITVGSKEENKKLFDYILNNLTFDQLIDEYDFSWVHVSYSSRRTRKEVLYTLDGKSYMKGPK